KGKNILKKLWAMLAKAAEGVKALFVRFLDLFRTSNEKNERSAAILKQDIAGRSENLKNAEAKLKNTGLGELVVGDKVDVIGALDLVNKGYTEHLAKTHSEV